MTKNKNIGIGYQVQAGYYIEKDSSYDKDLKQKIKERLNCGRINKSRIVVRN